MTTLIEILDRPDIRELCEAVHAAYAQMQVDLAYAASVSASGHNVRPNPDGHPSNRVQHGERIAEDAQARYRDALVAYHEAVNAACAESIATSSTGTQFEPDGDFWQTLREAAMVLGVTPDTLRQQIHKGSIKGEKRGRDWYIRRTEVTRYARDHQRKTS